jgi:hypothetical protein
MRVIGVIGVTAAIMRYAAQQWGAVILAFFPILRQPIPDTLRAQGLGNWLKKIST